MFSQPGYTAIRTIRHRYWHQHKITGRFRHEFVGRFEVIDRAIAAQAGFAFFVVAQDLNLVAAAQIKAAVRVVRRLVLVAHSFHEHLRAVHHERERPARDEDARNLIDDARRLGDREVVQGAARDHGVEPRVGEWEPPRA